MALRLSIQLLSWLVVLLAICVSATYPKTARLGLSGKAMESKSEVRLPPEFVTYFYTQTLDHFNYRPESYTTFQQRYIINSVYWGGANTSSPIFVYTGDEASITDVAMVAGFITEIASHFKALMVFIEHRYYGVSMPFGLREEAFSNASTLGYFSSTQALADYAELITYLKRNLSAENSPVIAVGGSYGGMLASWFRLKYPHIAMGALASSAPILYFDDITPQNGYFVVVTKDFREASESCYDTIRQSWFEIDRVAAEPNGLTVLSQIFSTCKPLNSSQELKDYLGLVYAASAQYDNPPDYPVNMLCNAIDGAPEGTDILGRISVGLNSSIFGHQPCNYIFDLKPSNKSGWIWQDIKSVLDNFGSNIIFSNGLRDPYSSGGVLQNISDSVVAIYTAQGAHCLDLLTPLPSDPVWLVSQRNTEISIIEGWLTEYMNATLASNTHGRSG
ncbi:hypothetical protein HHK36_011272 [Tetracentron sinense]|uniref:Lysosomal Pro-X carboxypeptidase n=1 Tax=Tetracentron sinense TaxID=13715 RepID=A0A834Z9X7_TETSI|nr:hypothetical protein HHK36_011272 [Tetracentron sinense]